MKAEAIEFLQDFLSRGEMAAKDAETAARNAGVSSKSLRSAKAALRVVTRREGFGPGAIWFWGLPGHHRCPRPP